VAHHLVNPEREYRLLQQRLDRNVTGAPASPVFTKILKLLFTPEQATVARRLPTRPTPLDELSRKVGLPEEELGDKLTEMAGRGLVIDLEHEMKRYFALPPVVIGLFEFAFMRTGEDAPMKELARLFEQYMNEDDRFSRAVFRGQTQLGRSMVREEALSEGDRTEILDWERASHIVQSADSISVGICSCHHKKQHLGKACERPQKVCLSFGPGAEMLVRNGMAEPATIPEAMRILERAKAAGLAQTADNVERDVGYMCNCCGCCCAMMNAIRRYDIRNAIVSSNWIMEVDRSQCNGCGDCVDACPVRAISLEVGKIGRKKRRWAVRDEALCLGCGTCHPTCKYGGIGMTAREQRVFTPETTFDRMVTMAIERGKLANLIFNEPEGLGYRALGRILDVLENTPPVKAALAVRPLRSAFLNALVKGGAGSSSGPSAVSAG
jgi:Na+-translocating ferredoxin:NAD+ oxidoreductase RNF subunit RnfB